MLFSSKFYNTNGLINPVLIMLFVSSTISDLIRRKIYNHQTYTAILCGFFLNYLAGGREGMFFSFLGLITGLSLLFPFYLLGGVGGGDVKYLGAVGALKGAHFGIWTLFYTGLIGGAIALSIIIWQGNISIKDLCCYILHPFQEEKITNTQYHYIPYGLAISLGCLWALCTV